MASKNMPGSTVVENSTHNDKFSGSNPASGDEKQKKGKRSLGKWHFGTKAFGKKSAEPREKLKL
jgi:hypothetical protein